MRIVINTIPIQLQVLHLVAALGFGGHGDHWRPRAYRGLPIKYKKQQNFSEYYQPQSCNNYHFLNTRAAVVNF